MNGPSGGQIFAMTFFGLLTALFGWVLWHTFQSQTISGANFMDIFRRVF